MEKLWLQILGLYSMEMELCAQTLALLNMEMLWAQILGQSADVNKSQKMKEEKKKEKCNW